CTTMVFW
nr:immunoglobulin heavy chain junction region [Macaca mulatta]MOW91439.1 immunoglobulin heavy chain junction region [Macaca mulatta]